MNLDYKKNNINFNFSFGFNKDNLFFKDVICLFESGHINFITGKNGVGKSTLIRILSGTIDQTEYIDGSVIINNIQKYNLSEKKFYEFFKNNVRCIVQDYDLMLAPHFSVRENIKVSQFEKYPFMNIVYQDAIESKILSKAGIVDTKLVQELSGGQKQITAIVMALQKKPQILLLDEPTAALDDHNAKIVKECLEEIISKNDIIVICISHDYNWMESFQLRKNFKIVKEDCGLRRIHE